MRGVGIGGPALRCPRGAQRATSSAENGACLAGVASLVLISVVHDDLQAIRVSGDETDLEPELGAVCLKLQPIAIGIIGFIPASAAAAVAGNGSAPEPRFDLLAVGSAMAGVPTFPVLSVALFQVPKTATGS